MDFAYDEKHDKLTPFTFECFSHINEMNKFHIQIESPFDKTNLPYNERFPFDDVLKF